jgi:hypothetical protein
MAPDNGREPAPFNIVRAAMLLIAAVILTGCAITLLVAVRCILWPDQYCADKAWGQTVREWLAETLAVLVAIALGWRGTNGKPPPPEDKP